MKKATGVPHLRSSTSCCIACGTHDVAFARDPMSLFSMTAEPLAAQRETASLSRFAKPALGFALPVGLAILWEIAVRAGFSDGRLVPPPSRIWATLVELTAAGE